MQKMEGSRGGDHDRKSKHRYLALLILRTSPDGAKVRSQDLIIRIKRRRNCSSRDALIQPQSYLHINPLVYTCHSFSWLAV